MDTLNEAQRSAVTAPPGAHLVVAGAGTGKTRTLVHRVAWLIEQGAEPSHIVLVTFTRRAAAEMLTRVGRLVGLPAARVRGGTFHALALHALRRFAPLLGYPRNFTVLDVEDSRKLIALVRAELDSGQRTRRFPRSDTLHKLFSKRVNTQRDLAELVEAEAPQYLDQLAGIQAVAERYAARKVQLGVVDYDDLLVLFRDLLVKHPEARAQLAGAAHHVLVDEYQDTNRLQARIALTLSVAHGDLMVVGDEAQSIYGFRGAVVENMLDFPSILPDCRVTLLQDNYRSSQAVLDLANAVMAGASRSFDKRLRAALPQGQRPALVSCEDEDEQAQATVAHILTLREEGVPLREQAVLIRSGYHGNLLEPALVAAHIPYRKFGGLRFTESAHIKDVVALLRMVANPRDELAWFRVLRWLDGVGERTAQRLSAEVSEHGRIDLEAHRGRRYGEELTWLLDVWERARAMAADLAGVVALLLEAYETRIERLYDDAHKRLRDLDTLSLLAERREDLDDLLGDLALDPVGDSDNVEEDAEDEWLTLSTVHSAKGLEWDAVTVLNLRDGAFPASYALDDDDALDEERRLLYVAITRARRHLWLCQPMFVRSRWGRAAGPGCSLLDDLPDDLFEHIRAEAPQPQATTASAAEIEGRMARIADWFGD